MGLGSRLRTELGWLGLGLGSRLRTELGWLGFGWMPIITLSSMKSFWGLLCSLLNKQRLLRFSMQCVGHPSKISNVSSCKPIAWFWCFGSPCNALGILARYPMSPLANRLPGFGATSAYL
ncbi:hypothetical protein CsSME_00041874 [Camellia sinensis var. sinensis]